jgi:hypothetical protein
MTCTLILIGNQADNRLQPEAVSSAAPIFTVVASCPNCEHATKVVVTESPTEANTFAVRAATVFPDKPAESYVLQFANGDAAMAWINLTPSQFVGKTIVLIESGG